MVTLPGLKPGLTGCHICALTATPKSPAQWHGSQRAYSTVGTITSSHCPHHREAHPCASRTQASTNHASPIQSTPHKRFTQPWGPSHGASPNHGVLHTGSTFLGVPHTMFMGEPPMTSQQGIPLLTPFVAKGEQGHPTQTRTQVYRVPNMLSDCHTKEPGSMAWPPESIFIRSDDHIVTLPST